MGGPNLEVFKFGMYILFPIGFMYYFGTNLDSRFAVPDFWPKQEQTNQIPFEKEEIKEELQRLRERRLAARARRLESEKQDESAEMTINREGNPRPEILETMKVNVDVSESSQNAKPKPWLSWLR